MRCRANETEISTLILVIEIVYVCKQYAHIHQNRGAQKCKHQKIYPQPKTKCFQKNKIWWLLLEQREKSVENDVTL